MTNRIRITSLGWVMAAILALPAAGRAQHVTFEECQSDRVWNAEVDSLSQPFAFLHPVATYERARGELARTGRWPLAVEQVRTSFRLLADAAQFSAARRGLVEAQLDAMERDLKDYGGSERGLENAGRFVPHVTPAAAEFTFGGSRTVLTVTADEPLAAIRAVCWPAIAADALLTFANANARDTVLQGLDRAVAAWDAFAERGYAQYPWELVINRPGDDLMPPWWQVVLLHPAPGLELAGVEAEGTVRRLETILIEPIGLLWYTDARSMYAGASVLTSFPAGERPGVGPMLHVGPYLKVGYAFRGGDSAESVGNTVVVTADLLHLVAGVPEQYRQARERVASLLDSAVVGYQPD